MFYNSSNNSPDEKNGMGFILSQQLNKNVKNLVAYSAKIILMQLQAKPVNVNYILVYEPAKKTQIC